METKVVGQRVKRYDGMAHVTGETRFVDDVIVPGTQTVKALRSPVIKGKIKKLDTSAAEAMPGVAGVITAEDVPCNAYGLVPDQPVLAADAVRVRVVFRVRRASITCITPSVAVCISLARIDDLGAVIQTVRDPVSVLIIERRRIQVVADAVAVRVVVRMARTRVTHVTQSI